MDKYLVHMCVIIQRIHFEAHKPDLPHAPSVGKDAVVDVRVLVAQHGPFRTRIVLTLCRFLPELVVHAVTTPGTMKGLEDGDRQDEKGRAKEVAEEPFKIFFRSICMSRQNFVVVGKNFFSNLPEYTPKIMMAQKVVDAESKTTNRVFAINNWKVRFKSGKEAIICITHQAKACDRIRHEPLQK